MPIFDYNHPKIISLLRVATLIFDHAQPSIFQSTFNFHEFVSICKKLGFSLYCSRDIVDLKTLQSDWPRAFWSISQEQDFYNMIFHYGPNSEKNNY